MAEHPPVTSQEARILAACILSANPEEIDHFVVIAARKCKTAPWLHAHMVAYCDNDQQTRTLIQSAIGMV